MTYFIYLIWRSHGVAETRANTKMLFYQHRECRYKNKTVSQVLSLQWEPLYVEMRSLYWIRHQTPPSWMWYKIARLTLRQVLNGHLETKLPTFFFRRYFRCIFLNKNVWILFLKAQLVIIQHCSDNGLAPNRRQVIIWTDHGLNWWCIRHSAWMCSNIY